MTHDYNYNYNKYNMKLITYNYCYEYASTDYNSYRNHTYNLSHHES